MDDEKEIEFEADERGSGGLVTGIIIGAIIGAGIALLAAPRTGEDTRRRLSRRARDLRDEAAERLEAASRRTRRELRRRRREIRDHL